MSQGKSRRHWLYLLIWFSILPVMSTGCWQADLEQLPPRPDVTLKQNPSFNLDVLPIFNDFCVKCHNPRDAHMGLRLDTYDEVLKGRFQKPEIIPGQPQHEIPDFLPSGYDDKYIPVVIPGHPQQSILLKVIKRETPPFLWMPFHQEPLTSNRIQNIENWVIQGALNN